MPVDLATNLSGHTLLAAAVIGVFVGFLGGLLGKGGSAIATPLLHLAGVPAIVAIASPLPATIPSTTAAGYAYARERLIDWRVVRWCVAFGIPATMLGALATRWVSGDALVVVTDVVLVALGVKLLLGRQKPAEDEVRLGEVSGVTLALLAISVGGIAGLLGNSGGFLLAPLFMTVLKLPIKKALACSLAIAAVFAIPGSLVHAALGHIDWTLVAVFAATSVPLSVVGAKVALRTDAHRLERVYGAALAGLGAAFLVTAT